MANQRPAQPAKGDDEDQAHLDLHLIPTPSFTLPSPTAVSMGLSYKAGRCFRNGTSNTVDANPQKGQLSFEQEDGRELLLLTLLLRRIAALVGSRSD